MASRYYSDRTGTPRVRTEEIISLRVWDALSSEIDSRVQNGSFGLSFPLTCDDAPVTIGCNSRAFYKAAYGNIPDLVTERNATPPTLAILDFLEFCFERVAEPIQIGRYHDFLRHHHLTFDRERGQQKFLRDVNLILARNGLAYELGPSGEVLRIAPPLIREAVKASFSTGDRELDALLEEAVSKYLNPDIRVRGDSLQKLWDAWERLKSLEDPNNKRASIAALFSKALPAAELREVANSDGEALTAIGNAFMIRHSEVGKVPIERSEEIDYLFHRLFALMRLLLRATGRGG
jgi:hypothetical protein